jgi:AraC family transcriptional activator of pobA
MLGNLEFVDLYGEKGRFWHQTFLYCEPLTQRSARHEWKIHPHRHQHITQIFVLTEGGVEVQFDDEHHRITAPALLYIPDGVMHGFDWQSHSQGTVLSVASPMLRQVEQNIGESVDTLAEAFVLPVNEVYRSALQVLCTAIQQEASSASLHQGSMLQALLQQLLILMHRMQPARAEEGSLSKPERKLRQFQQLIRQHFTEQHKVAWYARQIGVSQAHLNQICQQYFNSNALALIHNVLISEAKRYLIFSDTAVADIAERLGFNEPGYFNKFFKRHTGLSPAAYRRQSQG